MWQKPEEIVLAEDAQRLSFDGKSGAIFWLIFKTTFLTLITLGIYRFWARARVRKFIWSNTKLGSDGLEYSGTGLEKFLGFLIALVVLAIYLGILQVVLTFAGINMFGTILSEPNSGADEALQALVFNITFLALLPLMFFATYRARRYFLSRTTFRGVRLGMEQAAIKYMFFALLMMGLCVVTLGLAVPYALFKLEKFVTDRTWFGDEKFHQGGTWWMMCRPCLHIVLGILVTLGISLGVATFLEGSQDAGEQNLGLLFIGPLWIILGLIYFQVRSFAVLTGHKALGDKVRFEATPKFKSVLGYWLLYLFSALGLIVFFALIIAGPMFLLSVFFLEGAADDPLSVLGPSLILGSIILGYILLIMTWPAMTMAVFTMPIFGHFVTSTIVHGVSELEDFRQRQGDDIADADGFADALDIGGAF